MLTEMFVLRGSNKLRLLPKQMLQPQKNRKSGLYKNNFYNKKLIKKSENRFKSRQQIVSTAKTNFKAKKKIGNRV